MYENIFECVRTPVGLPDVDGLGVGYAVVACLVVQQVEKVLDRQGYGPTGAQDHCEQVVHKLLESSLERERETSMERE